jgi:Uncharacterized conserved protein (DUF2190)
MAIGAYPVVTVSVVATAALTQFRATNVAGALPGAAARSLGFARTNAAIGERVAVDVVGTCVAESGAAITAGAALELDAAGRVITKSAGVTVGHALTAATAIGQQVEVQLIPN